MEAADASAEIYARSHIVVCSHGYGLHSSVASLLTAAQLDRMSEVCQDHPSTSRRRAHQNIFRLEVSMADPLLMKVLKSF